ncbi:MAG TPA: sugar ABC transporter substrate-binding protein [Solirubrobacterales bacterium]|nr:sugar ABC transporter substrate-binding protein [Solirubrobacterales bacterium]
MGTHGKMILAILAAIAVVAVVAGCGSSSDSSGTSSGGGESSEADQGGLAEAEKLTQEGETRPTSIGLDKPISKPIPAGKHIEFVIPSVPSTLEFVPNLEAAAEAVGWTAETVEGGTSPEEFKAAYEQVVRNKPDAVVSAGIPPEAVEPELEELNAAKIPIVLISAEPLPKNAKVLADVAEGETHYGYGQLLANWTTSDGGGNPDTLLINVPEFPVLDELQEGFETQYAKVCPNCTLETKSYPAGSIGKELPQTIASYLRSHSEVKYVVATFSDMLLGVPGALSEAGITDVKLAGNAATPANVVNIAAENYEAAGSLAGLFENPWHAVDALARYFAGEPQTPKTNSTQPEWILTKKNEAEWGGKPEDKWPIVADYEAQYKALWGLK